MTQQEEEQEIKYIVYIQKKYIHIHIYRERWYIYDTYTKQTDILYIHPTTTRNTTVRLHCIKKWSVCFASAPLFQCCKAMRLVNNASVCECVCVNLSLPPFLLFTHIAFCYFSLKLYRIYRLLFCFCFLVLNSLLTYDLWLNYRIHLHMYT